MEIKPPGNEVLIGMEVYKSDTPGIGGRIKVIPEDFIVEEITEEGRVVEVGGDSGEPAGPVRDNLLLTMEKYNWETLRAIRELSRHLHASPKRIGFAGTKDKRALTTQRLSVHRATVEDFAPIKIKDIIFRNFCYSDDNIALGSLYGNRFTLTIRNLEDDIEEIRKRVSLIIEELRSQAPAFYGLQRFGTVRPITSQRRFPGGGDGLLGQGFPGGRRSCWYSKETAEGNWRFW
jgi:tRNA pseudouridine13 synthase